MLGLKHLTATAITTAGIELLRSTPIELAREVDFLVAAMPEGPETHHLIDRAVLDALGATGNLVNIGR
jgi:lactate dehydrogenase-like 2-hydroxyacid dehydrogenase